MATREDILMPSKAAARVSKSIGTSMAKARNSGSLISPHLCRASLAAPSPMCGFDCGAGSVGARAACVSRNTSSLPAALIHGGSNRSALVTCGISRTSLDRLKVYKVCPGTRPEIRARSKVGMVCQTTTLT